MLDHASEMVHHNCWHRQILSKPRLSSICSSFCFDSQYAFCGCNNKIRHLIRLRNGILDANTNHIYQQGFPTPQKKELHFRSRPTSRLFAESVPEGHGGKGAAGLQGPGSNTGFTARFYRLMSVECMHISKIREGGLGGV